MAVVETPLPRITRRLIVDGSTDAAQSTWSQVRRALKSLTLTDEPLIIAYWKFPDTQEVSCTLRPTMEPAEVFEEVARRLASGGSEQTDDLSRAGPYGTAAMARSSPRPCDGRISS